MLFFFCRYPASKAAEEHYENLRGQYAESIARIRSLCDDAIDSARFTKISGKLFKCYDLCMSHKNGT